MCPVVIFTAYLIPNEEHEKPNESSHLKSRPNAVHLKSKVDQNHVKRSMRFRNPKRIFRIIKVLARAANHGSGRESRRNPAKLCPSPLLRYEILLPSSFGKEQSVQLREHELELADVASSSTSIGFRQSISDAHVDIAVT